MKTFITNAPRHVLLRKIYQWFPFDLNGDLAQPLPEPKDNFISCLVPTARKSDVIEQLLAGLTQQTLNKDQFEVIILDSGSQGLGHLLDKYKDRLPLKLLYDISQQGLLSDLRNKLLKEARGAYVLTLDDDTRISQRDLLEKALAIFKDDGPDVIMPQGKGLVQNDASTYCFLDPYSFATRCCLFKRSILEAVGGDISELSAYDDIELGIRLSLRGAAILKTDELNYEHPPLFFDSLRKPIVIGQSIFKLQNHYPWYMWLLIYLNALRFLPLGLFPTIRNRQWFKISWGVLIAPFVSRKHTYRG